MSTALTPKPSTSNFLRYQFIADEPNGVAARTQASMIDDAATSNVQSLLAAATTDEAWIALAQKFAITGRLELGVPRGLTAQFEVVDGTRQLTVTAKNKGFAAGFVELIAR